MNKLFNKVPVKWLIRVISIVALFNMIAISISGISGIKGLSGDLTKFYSEQIVPLEKLVNDSASNNTKQDLKQVLAPILTQAKIIHEASQVHSEEAKKWSWGQTIFGIILSFIVSSFFGAYISKKFTMYEGILDSIKFPISVADMNGQWLFFNKAVEKTLNKNRKEQFGCKCSDWNRKICNSENCGIHRKKKGNEVTFFKQENAYFRVDTAHLKGIKGENIGYIELFSDITNIYNQAQSLKEATTKLLTISQQNSTTSSELQNSTINSASASEQISANINSVSTAAGEIAASIKDISSNTQTAQKTSNDIAMRSSDAVRLMTDLTNSSNEISSIINIITSIAEQTNLLALNATIEAARAGEVGKGFAVVANEVKSLALESSKSADSIRQNIKKAVDDTQSAVRAINEIATIAADVNQITSSIASAIEEQSVTISEVSKNISDVSVGASSIMEINNNISGEAQNLVSSSNVLNELTGNLSELSVQLDKQLS